MFADLTWVDVSEGRRQQMMELLNNWAERGILDELGVGTIRDAFSQYFFPGITTIQTRARYMLFVPWMYRDLEQQEVSSSEISDRARLYEEDIIVSLNTNCPEEDGIIGAEAGRSIGQTPATNYWTGLATWGLRWFEGTRRAYHRHLDTHYRRLKQHHQSDREMRRDIPRPRNWHPGLPDPPITWPEPETLQLRRTEAVFLRDRILEEHPDTLLAHLIRLRVADRDVNRFWELPQIEQVPEELAEEIDRARCYAELMQAADLVYALVLAEMDESAENPDDYLQQLEEWAQQHGPRREAYERYSDSRQWQAVQARKPSSGALAFERRWRRHVLSLGDFRRLTTDKRAKRMIREREVAVKGRRARVRGGRQLETWRGSGEVGTQTFRWGTASDIIADIVEGLEREQSA